MQLNLKSYIVRYEKSLGYGGNVTGQSLNLKHYQRLLLSDEGLLIEQRQYDPDAATLINEAGGLEAFVRSLIGLERSAVRKTFAAFIRESNFNANQIELF